MRIHMRQIKTINGQSGPVLEGKCLLFASGFFFSIKRASRAQNLLAPFWLGKKKEKKEEP